MFVVIWEYIVTESQKSEFEKIYGPKGDWAQLFSSDRDYLGTELLRVLESPNHYITIDRWTSSAAYDSFHEKYRAAYEAMDARCENLTERETLLGRYNLILST
jgi:heme-degrading monooxygenase HmoA